MESDFVKLYTYIRSHVCMYVTKIKNLKIFTTVSLFVKKFKEKKIKNFKIFIIVVIVAEACFNNI